MRRYFEPPVPFATALVLVLIGFALMFVLGVLGSMTFFDDFVQLSSRILAPVYVTGMIAIVGLAGRWLARVPQSDSARWLRLFGGGLLAVLTISYGLQGVDWVARNYATGEDLGVGGLAWRESPLIAMIEDLPPDTPMATNRQDALYVVADRLTYHLPIPYNPVTAQENPIYEDELEVLGNLLAEGNGVVAYFLPESRVYIPSIEDMEASWNICRTETVADGFLYLLCTPSHR